MSQLQGILIFSLTLVGVFSQKGFPRSCINYAPIENFDLNKFQGIWYEISRYDYTSDLIGSECASLNVTIGVQEENVATADLEFNFKRRLNDVLAKDMISYKGVAKLSSTENSDLEISYKIEEESEQIIVKVLAANDESFLIVWSCLQNDTTISSSEYAWILTRDKKIDEKTETKINETINLFFNPYFLRKTDQSHETCSSATNAVLSLLGIIAVALVQLLI